MSSSTTATVIERAATVIKSKIINSKSVDQRYQDSFGDQLTDFGGYNRWVLTGCALSVWEKELRARIGELIKANENYIHKDHDVLSTATIHHCWMIGHGRQNAAPTVIISHNVRKVLKRVMRIIKQHKILESYDFEMKGCPFCDLQLFVEPFTSQSLHNIQGERNSSALPLPNTQFLVGGSLDQQIESMQWKRKEIPISLCGAHVATKDPAQRATLGGTIILNGECYGLTVAHIFVAVAPSPGRGDYPTADRTLYGSDWADSSSEENSMFDEKNGTGMHDNSRDSVSDDDSDDNDEDGSASGLEILSIQAFPTTRFMSPDTTPAAGHDMLSLPYILGIDSLAARSSQSPFRTNLEGSYDDVDWAILKFPDSRLWAMNSTSIDGAQPRRLYFQDIARGTPQGQIIVATREGAVNAVAVGSADSIKLVGSNRHRNVYSIRPEKPLGPGSSGAWVVNAISGDIYGVLIAGSVFLQECFVIPMGEIFTDIKRVTKQNDLRLPSLEETAPTKKQIQSELRTNQTLTTPKSPLDSEQADIKPSKPSTPTRYTSNRHRDGPQLTESPVIPHFWSKPIKRAEELNTEISPPLERARTRPSDGSLDAPSFDGSLGETMMRSPSGISGSSTLADGVSMANKDPSDKPSGHTRKLETLATAPWTTSHGDFADQATHRPAELAASGYIQCGIEDRLLASAVGVSSGFPAPSTTSNDGIGAESVQTATFEKRSGKPPAEHLQNCENKVPRGSLLQMIRDGSEEAFEAALQNFHRGCSCLEERDEKGKTPLILAAFLGRVDMVESLLLYGADIQAVDNSQDTSLHVAIRHMHRSVVYLLLSFRDTGPILSNGQNSGVDVNRPDRTGRTPLHCCTISVFAETDTRAVVKDLIAQGANVNAKDNFKLPPIYYAIKSRRYLIVELLLDKGAGIDFQRPEKTSAEIGKLLDDHLRGKKVYNKKKLRRKENGSFPTTERQQEQ